MTDLTPREEQIMELLAEDGDNWSDIAVELGIQPKTVKTHATHLFIKYQAHNRTQLLVRYLREEGLLSPVIGRKDGNA